MTTRTSRTDRQQRIEELIQRLSETNEALQAFGRGELDAVVDPSSAAPILLSRAQKALSESEAQYRDLISRCPALVCEASPDGRALFVNNAVRTLLGREPEDVIGKSLWEFLTPAEHLGQARKLTTLVRRRDVNGFELPLESANDGLRWIVWTTANRYTDDGALLQIIAFGIDITERRRAEENAHALLEAQVALQLRRALPGRIQIHQSGVVAGLLDL